MNITNEMKAEVLVQALPYIKKYAGEIIVVKYGGSAMSDCAMKTSVMNDLVLLKQIGVKVVLVHGGGPEINEMLIKIGKTPEFVNGLRKTDAETMDVVQMVLAGKINKDLVNIIESEGGSAMGMCGIDGHMLEAEPISDELGFVGDIIFVNTEPIIAAIEANSIPVVASLGCDDKGHAYNINADAAATKIAGALNAKCLINMTDKMGILRDKNDESTLIHSLNVSDVPALIKNGIISGGMIPKAECCVEAIRRGVKQVFIINGNVEHSILIEILSDEGIGTMFI